MTLREAIDENLNGTIGWFPTPVRIALALAVLLYCYITVLFVMNSLPRFQDETGEFLGLYAEMTLGVYQLLLLLAFSAEYVLRLWSTPDRKRYATSLMGFVDLSPALVLGTFVGLFFLFPESLPWRSWISFLVTWLPVIPMSKGLRVFGVR